MKLEHMLTQPAFQCLIDVYIKLNGHITICKPVVMCTGGKVTTKSVMFLNRKEQNYVKFHHFYGGMNEFQNSS